MPAMHLISVDLPAPLSPPSAITSPRRTSKSTSVRAWTEPKDLDTPRSSRRGVSATMRVLIRGTEGRPQEPPLCPAHPLLAVLRVLTVADVALLGVTARVELLPVRLRERHRLDQVRRLLAAALRRHEAGRRQLLTLDDRDRGLRGLGREDALVLPDRHRLPARDDVLDALRGGVLPDQRDGVQVMLLQVDDHCVRDAVVGGHDAVDLVAGLDQHLVEDRAGLLVVPARDELVRALLQCATRVQRLQNGVVPALEQERVRILLPTVQLG